MQVALHTARLAFVEAALLALLNEKDTPFDVPDTITVSLSSEGLDVQYFCNGVMVAGEGI